MGRRHRESRGRHPGAPNRSASKPSASRPAHDPRPRPAGEPESSADARTHASSPAAVSPPDEPIAPPLGPAGDVVLQSAHVRPADVSAAPIAADAPAPAATNGSLEGRLPLAAPRSGATPAQLRRFIKSRPYVPLHELRRRFGLNGHDDDVVSVQLENSRIWVGLPADEGRMLGELIRQGEVGCELSLDPTTPVVVGVFPIRPVARS